MPRSGMLSTTSCVREDGLWTQVLRTWPEAPRRPALFLDRDGVINEDVGYLHKVDEVRLIPGAVEVITEANRCGVPVAIVTNQGGIGLGYFGWDAFAEVQKHLLAMLASRDAEVDAVFACPYHPRGQGAYAHPDHPTRKPNPGMLLAAAELLPIDLSASWIVGDHARDIEAGKNAGLAGGVHVLTGHGSRDNQRGTALALAGDGFLVRAVASIADAEEHLSILSGPTPGDD